MIEHKIPWLGDQKNNKKNVKKTNPFIYKT